MLKPPHIRHVKLVAGHVASRGDHIAELCYFSTIMLSEHGFIAVFGLVAVCFTVVHIAWTFSNREG